MSVSDVCLGLCGSQIRQLWLRFQLTTGYACTVYIVDFDLVEKEVWELFSFLKTLLYSGVVFNQQLILNALDLTLKRKCLISPVTVILEYFITVQLH